MTQATVSSALGALDEPPDKLAARFGVKFEPSTKLLLYVKCGCTIEEVSPCPVSRVADQPFGKVTTFIDAHASRCLCVVGRIPLSAK